HEAMEIFDWLLPEYRARGDLFNQARCKAHLGAVHRELGDRRRALPLLEEAQDVFRRLRAVQHYLLHGINFGVLLGDEGAFARAPGVFEELQAAAEECGEKFLAAMACIQRSWYELRRGRIAAALELSEAASGAFERLEDRNWLSYALRCRA